MLTNKSTLIMARLQAMQCMQAKANKEGELFKCTSRGRVQAAVLQSCRVASGGQTAGAPFKL